MRVSSSATAALQQQRRIAFRPLSLSQILLRATWPRLGDTRRPAAASCSFPPRESPYRFAGVVLATDDGGRTATVRAEAGRIVTVVGAEGGTGAFTSVDRTYKVGARYEFHPLNNSDPYRDNACTATRALGGQPDSRKAGEGIADRSAGGRLAGSAWLHWPRRSWQGS
jgi:hypothetical protein